MESKERFGTSLSMAILPKSSKILHKLQNFAKYGHTESA